MKPHQWGAHQWDFLIFGLLAFALGCLITGAARRAARTTATASAHVRIVIKSSTGTETFILPKPTADLIVLQRQ